MPFFHKRRLYNTLEDKFTQESNVFVYKSLQLLAHLLMLRQVCLIQNIYKTLFDTKQIKQIT